jgi:hypothetical protein
MRCNGVARTTPSPGQTGMPGINGTETSIGFLDPATILAPIRRWSFVGQSAI